MAKNLVIVESPAKVKTIKKFLGSNYDIEASNGHVRDLPKSSLGIDIENDYEPRYITIRGKGEVLSRLRKAVKKADNIYLATDPDREGEAISWHLTKALKLDECNDKKVNRISFNEITKNAVLNSFKHPRELDMNLVDAQQTRRMLDRMVGYSISPLLWSKIKRGLSAGRVQSAALRMVCDRDEEIDKFIPEEFWLIDAEFRQKGSRRPLCARLYGKKGRKLDIHSRGEVDEILNDLDGAGYKVSEVKTTERLKKAPLPFTTSTLQQEASKVLNLSPQNTMRYAQQLYEGVEIKGMGTVALITYLRTDSTRVADEAQESAYSYIKEKYGTSYAVRPAKSQNTGSSRIQDAHEAIRPVDVTLTPERVKDSLSREQYRLYDLIWKRFMASRMKAARYESTAVKVEAKDYEFRLSGSRQLFDGYLKVYVSSDDAKEEKDNQLIAKLREGEVLTLQTLQESQHFTQPPAHYTEASLVKALEDEGIGRPSTYAPIISTILSRHYVTKEKKNLYATELGQAVDGVMKDYFPSIVDTTFTANLEQLLDRVEDGTMDWKTIVRNFYPDLEQSVKAAESSLENIKIADEETDVICENCGRRMVIKYGPHGKFLACPGFPECRNTKPYLEKIGVPCPKCGKEVVKRKTQKGRTYYSCEDFTNCDFKSWQKPSALRCPKCGAYMVEKGNTLLCSEPTCGHKMKNEQWTE